MKSVKLLVHLLVDVSLVQKVREILQVSLYKTYIYDNICVMKIKCNVPDGIQSWDLANFLEGDRVSTSLIVKNYVW